MGEDPAVPAPAGTSPAGQGPGSAPSHSSAGGEEKAGQETVLSRDGRIWRHQLSSLLIRILMKQLGDERQTKNILNSSPYKTMTSGMGLEKRGRVHEIEFLACFAFCVREYLDMKTVFQKRVQSRVATNRNPFYTADEDDMELPDHLANRSSYHNPLSELDSSLNSSHNQSRMRVRSGQSQAVKDRVSRGEEANEGWMMY